MRKFITILIFLVFVVSGIRGQSLKMIMGAEQPEKYLPLIQNKRVALVVNHTSLVGQVHLVDFLQNKKIEIEKIFAPEHGFRGDVSAGAEITDSSYTCDIVPKPILFSESL